MFSFGGVAVELLPEPGFGWQLPAETEQHLRHGCASQAAPTVAAVACSVRVDPSLTVESSAVPHGGVMWEQTLDGVQVRSSQVVLEIASLGAQHYVVAARIGSGALLTRMLNMLAATIVELAGGLCLHATAVALQDNAVLLLGPSGAGKTTAAQLLGEVCCLSNDRVCVVPDPACAGKFWAWSLPIGRPPMLPRCAEVALPLAATLRVVQAPISSVSPSREVEALLQLRQAVEVSMGAEFFEPQRLAAVSALARAANSGIARVALSPSWRAQLDAFLARPPAADSVSTENATRRVDGVAS